MSAIDDALSCLECGQPITGAVGLVCSPRCSAVIRLVRYGRTHAEWREGGKSADEGLLNRYRREAEVLGHFPTSDAVTDARQGARPRCRFPGCSERDVEFIDWRSDDPDLSRVVRADDLRTLCAHHHRAEAVRRFIGPLGQTARTAPAVWARMTAVQPLVLRDNEALWKDSGNLAFLSHWPLASAQTREDLDAWVAALPAALSASRAEAASADRDEGSVGDWLDKALAGLDLPPRRRDRVVRAINALLLRWQADEVVREGMQQWTSDGEGAASLHDTR